MFWLDPQRGARRRAEARQRALFAAKQASDAARVSAVDLAHRSRGVTARVRNRLDDLAGRVRGENVDDLVLTQRVRAKLGRLCSHPRAVTVTCRDGRVELAGAILKSEQKRVVSGISKVRGVRWIDDHLEAHETAGNIPELQGGSVRIERPELLQENWAPATRTLMGAAGLGLIGWGAAQRGLLGAGTGLVGLGILLRGALNLPARRLTGIGAGRRAIDLEKHAHIAAPPETVFAYFRQFENFPRIMSHVREVVRHGDQQLPRWRWSVTGPAGTTASWDAELTQFVPHSVIAWRSVPGSMIQNAGMIRFEPEDGGTRIDIRLSYNPPGGAIGHALVAALGADPKKQLDDDLMRFKSLMETGKAKGSTGTVEKDELRPDPMRPVH